MFLGMHIVIGELLTYILVT